MKVNENLSILFYLNTPKKSKDGLVPIYVRITIDGKKDEFSSGKKINPEYWNAKTGATKDCPDQKVINSYTRQNRDWKNATTYWKPPMLQLPRLWLKKHTCQK